MSSSIRVATYNVHKCRGIDLRTSPKRIAAVLREIDADVLALQEVWSVAGSVPERDQAHYLSEALGLRCITGRTRDLLGGVYGNVVLSRLQVRHHNNFNISVEGREERGCLRVDIAVGGLTLHVFNMHLGTSFIERRKQAELLIALGVLEHEDQRGPRIVMGDFNEWTAGAVSDLLSARFQSVDIRMHLSRSRTYPGVLPLVHLDHIYHDPELQLRSVHLHRTRAALWASDHLPLVAEFQLPEQASVDSPARRVAT